MINASAIHDHKLVLRYFRSLAHRALAPAASAGLFSPQQPQSSHRVFAPRQNLLSLQQPTEHFVIQWEYIKTVKHEIRLSLFHLAAPRSEKNAVCPVRVCLATINPQSPQMGFVCPVKACFPPTSPQSTLSFNAIFQGREKRNRLKKSFDCILFRNIFWAPCWWRGAKFCLR